MIVEVRSYRIKPGKRDEFIKFFETRSVPALREYGMKIVGPLLDVENPNKVCLSAEFPVARGARANERRFLQQRYLEERARIDCNADARELRRHTLRGITGLCL